MGGACGTRGSIQKCIFIEISDGKKRLGTTAHMWEDDNEQASSAVPL
jgi:hypothetical protein